MDNLAHTLVGAALGRAVADRKVPAAGWIGAIAGNAPDWSELLVSPGTWGGAPGSAPAYLVYHRGITHSFVGAVIEIVVLTGLVGLILTWRTRADAGARPPWRWIAVCVAAAVASHLYLDWQGSYGLRPFLPWSGRWYYGDWVAIVDPFFWARSEEHTSELQSRLHLVCRLLLEKKKKLLSQCSDGSYPSDELLPPP